jgi:D-3-phosphoglycerate dehydrogenase
VGLGAIGSLVAEMALTLGMDVVGYDPALSVEAAWRLSSQVRKADTLSALFARCDYISLHLPVLDSTRGLINSELLGAVRPGTCLLNFARQEIVDEGALLQALDEGKLRKYISDFPSPRLIGRDDVILTPHIGASTDEAEDNCAIMAAEQLRDFLENGNIRNSVNFPALQLERVTGCRLSVTNNNVPKILGSVLAILADQDINVIDMLNKSRDEIAYNLIDIDTRPAENVLDKMRELQGVINVRLIGDCV